MLTCIENLLTRDEVARLCQIAAESPFEAGALTAGRRLQNQKNNLQIAPQAPGKREADNILLGGLQRSAAFQKAALPKAIHHPTLSIYRDGMTYESHVDAAIMDGLRADVSITVFLREPDSYDGGALTVDAGIGAQSIKLPPGCAAVYPTGAFHWVTPVTRGERLAAIAWIQSAVPDAAKRETLYDLRTAIEELSAAGAEAGTIQRLIKTHSNLLRRWAAM